MKRKNVFHHLNAVEELLGLIPFGLLTDIDGTVSEIAPSPAEARVSPVCRSALERLVGELELVATISGRAASEAAAMVGVSGVVYLGNHGLEWLGEDGELNIRPDVRAYSRQIHDAISEVGSLISLQGIIVEDKGLTASVHYRQSPNPQDGRDAILEAVAASPSARGLKTTEGRMVVELRPPVEANKGTAVEWLVRKYNLKGAVYLGDDLTDVDAFGAVHSLSQSSLFRGLALAVVSGESPVSLEENADYILHGVTEVERFLDWLADRASSRS
ncbi:MAG: trehalose-phosphatase [Chloroflexota bacterium]